MTIDVSWWSIAKGVVFALLIYVVYQQQQQIIYLNNSVTTLSTKYMGKEEIAELFNEHNKNQAKINVMLGLYIQKIIGMMKAENKSEPTIPLAPKEEPKTDQQKRNENLRKELNGNTEYQA